MRETKLIEAMLFPGAAEALETIVSRSPAALYDMCAGQRVFFACLVAMKTGRPVVLVSGSENAAMRAAEDCSAWPGVTAAYLPAPELRFIRATSGQERKWQRLSVLSALRKGRVDVLCVSAEALQCPMMPAEEFDRACVTLRSGDRIEPRELIAGLTANGYERRDMVEGKGQCALRGAIVDVFPPDQPHALRVEFFDDEVDSVRAFDCISQRSLERTGEAEICPAGEYLPAGERGKALARIIRKSASALAEKLPRTALMPGLPPLPEEDDTPAKEDGEKKGKTRDKKTAAPKERKTDAPETPVFASAPVPRAMLSGTAGMLDDAAAAEKGYPFEEIALWAGAMYPDFELVTDYARDAVLLIDTPEAVRGRCEERLSGFSLELETAMERGEAAPEMLSALADWETLKPRLERHAPVTMQDFLHGLSGLNAEKVLKLSGTDVDRYENDLRLLAADLKRWRDEGRRVLLPVGGENRAKRLRDALAELGTLVPEAEEGKELPPLCVLTAGLSRGFVTEKLCVICDGDIFGTGHKKSRARRTAGEKIDAFTDLKEGDYVVHESHGVGIYMGTVRLLSEGTYRDFLDIRYAGSDKLYVPVDQFDRVQKFIGAQDTPPKLNALGGTEWERARSRVKAGLKKLAFDLVKLYAERRDTPGYAFSADTPWQNQFEDLFPYELTEDQAKAVADIKQDMESHTNMDRLLCGDVGYGKTEVALRAAFKAVMSGKQAAILAPTTILAQQHYYTLVKRLRDFPVQVEVLSRFRSRAQQNETLHRLAAGKVDILVGTHRLLGKDVAFKDLGLLIVDEEQRFGVAHKETIKNMKKTVDVLTLSATPIPRTLHMSMIGVRDMSLLETPPEERYPVQTYVVDYSDMLIRDAILRELGRGGQVYFLYNHVSSIDAFCSRLRTLVPEARIAVGHGQMKEQQLEDVMLDFYEHRSDVLLCSTIIENGLDVPEANTIIIYDADRFGLSQLYQLRGRVGRSNRTAYAYFTVRPEKMLSETAQKRLSAIREFTAFGSGFRIAMRDLEIRGAGNIFGPEQSGNISQVGYDMYCKLIEEAVTEARLGEGATAERAIDTRVDLKADAYLPGDYVEGDAQRMEIYKRISLIETAEDEQDAIEEIIDRFGDPPDCVINLIRIAHIKALARSLGMDRVSMSGPNLVLRQAVSFAKDTALLYLAMTRTDERLVFSPGRESAVLLRLGAIGAEKMLERGIPVLERLRECLREVKKMGVPETVN